MAKTMERSDVECAARVELAAQSRILGHYKMDDLANGGCVCLRPPFPRSGPQQSPKLALPLPPNQITKHILPRVAARVPDQPDHDLTHPYGLCSG